MREIRKLGYAGWIPPTVVCGGKETGGIEPDIVLGAAPGWSRL
jgi:hypothetical protein